MADQNLPDSIGAEIVQPSSLTPKQEELCKKLDELHSNYNLKVKPSDMFRGAIFTMRIELRSNTDWMAQSANSLREILYPFSHNGIPKKEEALRQFGSVRVNTELGDELGRVFGTLTELAHHGNGKSSSVDYLTYTVPIAAIRVTFRRLNCVNLWYDHKRHKIQPNARKKEYFRQIYQEITD